MSVLNPSSDPNKPYKNSFHWRNDSEELDVFEAAGYFSTAANDPNPGNITSSFQKLIREERHHHLQKPAGRMSLDRNPIPAEYQKQMIIKNSAGGKKFKQPSSPGGRLASFLNSLFNQASLKKKKPKAGAAARDDEISPGGRRKRRSSISHFRITATTAAATAPTDSKAVFPSGSGFRTPPPYIDTPTKLYREFRNLPDRRRETAEGKGGAGCEKFRIRDSSSGFSIMNPAPKWVDNSCPSDEKEFRKFSDGDDDGGDSDSSSDLFDLPNHDLDFYSSGLPVYGTTDMDRIKMGAPIPGATT